MYRTLKRVVQKDLVSHFCTLLISTVAAADIHCERHDRGRWGRQSEDNHFMRKYAKMCGNVSFSVLKEHNIHYFSPEHVILSFRVCAYFTELCWLNTVLLHSKPQPLSSSLLGHAATGASRPLCEALSTNLYFIGPLH